jgi:hypothetical protein
LTEILALLPIGDHKGPARFLILTGLYTFIIAMVKHASNVVKRFFREDRDRGCTERNCPAGKRWHWRDDVRYVVRIRILRGGADERV